MDDSEVSDFGESDLGNNAEGISQNKKVNDKSKYAPKNLYIKCVDNAKKFRENGKSLRYIGKHFNVSRTTVLRWFEKAEKRPELESKISENNMFYKIYGNPFWQYGMLTVSGYGKELDKESRAILQKSCDKKY
jgi:response regulator of citrate/malate metabolism